MMNITRQTHDATGCLYQRTIVYFTGNRALARRVTILITPLPVHATHDSCSLNHLSEDVCAHVTALTAQRCLRLTHGFA